MIVTIFTSTYNRAYILERLYMSLCQQTNMDFEWVIADDGSTDDTVNLVNEWMCKDNSFDIKLVQLEHGGKHRAINQGVRCAKGEAFFVVDSDDYLTHDAIEFIHTYFETIKCEPNCAGISGLCCEINTGKIVGGNAYFGNNEYIDCTNLERAKHGLGGDKAEIYKTDVLKKYPFPEYEGELFVTEDVIWNRIAFDGYFIRWVNKSIYYCEYRKDGLSRNIYASLKNSPKGWALSIVQNRTYNAERIEKDARAEYIYYEYLKDEYSDVTISQMLQIDAPRIKEIKEEWLRMSESFSSIIKEKSIRSVAVYGYGAQGQRVTRYLEKNGATISYIIDQKCEYINYPSKYTLDEELPSVDAICISINGCTKDLMSRIQQKIPDAYVWAFISMKNVII